MRWCRTRGRAAHGAEFARRCDYGDYVEQSFRSLVGTASESDLAVRLGTMVADIARHSDGFQLTLDGAAIGTHGPVPSLYVLGPGCRPNSWEHTAVPEIRAQAVSLAAELGTKNVARTWRERAARAARPRAVARPL